MTFAEIVADLKSKFGDARLAPRDTKPEPCLAVDAAVWREAARHLRCADGLVFDSLVCLSGADRGNVLAVVYHLHSMKHLHRMCVTVEVPRDNPVVPSMADIWGIANWHEREAYDLFGIVFEGHPDLRRIMMPDDWQGHPLRKDYQYPTQYHGVPHK
jgi:NADH-quinone oxidoreductase subunit C